MQLTAQQHHAAHHPAPPPHSAPCSSPPSTMQLTTQHHHAAHHPAAAPCSSPPRTTTMQRTTHHHTAHHPAAPCSSPPSSTPAPHLRVIRASLAPGPRVCKSICMHTTGRHAMSLRTWAGPGSWRFSTSPAPAPALELRHHENAMKVVCGTVEHAHCCVTPGNGQNHAHFVNHGAL